MTTLADAEKLFQEYLEMEGETTPAFLETQEGKVRSAFTNSGNYVAYNSDRDKEIKATTAELHIRSVYATLERFAQKHNHAEPEDSITKNIAAMRARLAKGGADAELSTLFEQEFASYARRAMRANGANEDETNEFLGLTPPRPYGTVTISEDEPPGTKP